MALELTLNQSGHVNTEAEELPKIVQKFEEIYGSELVNEAKRFNEKLESPYTKYRALSQTLFSRELNKTELEDSEAKILSEHLLGTPKYTKPFEEWIRVRTADGERKTLPRNAGKIHTFGKLAIKK